MAESLNLRTAQTWRGGLGRPLKASRGRGGILVLLILLCCAAGFLRYIGVFGGNIHTVAPGLVYRSAQLTGSNLNQVFERDHIRTDVNLRGGSMSNGWYRSEVASCRRFCVDHIDVTLSATKLPAPGQLALLLSVFDHAQYPILYHCQAGADRSGLVGAIYLDIYRHMSLRQALHSQLTWRYGHFGFGNSHAMDDFFKLYEETSNGMDLRTWITNAYPAIYAAQPAGLRR